MARFIQKLLQILVPHQPSPTSAGESEPKERYQETTLFETQELKASALVRLPSQEDLKRAELLRNATAEKQDDIEKAIESLRCAYTLIRDPEAEPIETYLRLPLYLQQGGRFDEAWFEANKLLKEFRYSRAKLNREVLPMDRSTIYDKMRLMLQREKRFEDAVLYAILSHVSWAIGLSRQRGRGIELKDTCDKETIGLMLKQPLKKAKLADREEPLVNLLCERLRSAKAIAVIDLDVLATEIRSVIEPPKPR